MISLRRGLHGAVLWLAKREGAVVECSVLRFSSSSSSSASSSSDVLKTTPNQTKVAADVKGVMQPKKPTAVFQSKGAPLNISFANEKDIDGLDPEMPAKEIIQAFPTIAKQNFKMLGEELKGSFSLEKKIMMENVGFLEHGETRKEFLFDSERALSKWATGCDSDRDQGYSKCELALTDRGTAVFRGKLSLQTVKDGKVERAGWAGIKLRDPRAFLRKKCLSRWASFSHLLVKCRGDGRSYKVMLHSPQGVDVTWGNSHSYPLHTHGGPYWQYEKIPFSRFFHTVYGRIQDRQYRVPLEKVSSIGIVLMDRIEGEFSLELDFIGVCHDRSHRENFAYESYSMPILNTLGM